MKSLTSKFASSRGWALLLILFVGAGLLVSACGDEETPAPTTPTPPPPPPDPPPPPAPDPPATPTGLAVSETTETSITWTWTAVEGATAYAVQVSLDETFTDDDAIALALTATYTVSDLPPSTSVFLRVRSAIGTSLEDALLSDWSTHVTGMTAMPPPPPEPPAVPTGLRVSDSGVDFVEWSWDAVEGAEGYEVQFATNEMFDDAETIGRTADQTSYRRQLPAGSTAYLRVRSHSGTGEDRLESAWSTHATGMTDQPMPPATPANLMVIARGENFLEWSWEEVAGADGYEVQYSLGDERFTSEDATAELAATETSYRIDNLSSEMDVYLRVRSFAGSGADRLESGWSTHVTGMTTPPAVVAPAMPSITAASGGDDYIEWRWSAVSGADGYEVWYSSDLQFNGGDPMHDVGTELTYRQTGLDFDTFGYLRVRAYAGSGEDRLSSDWTEAAIGRTNEAPPPPPAPAVPSIDAPATGGEGQVTWSWSAVDGADGYQVWYSANDAFTDSDPMDEVDAETLSYTRENLEAGTTHYLRVRSFIEGEDGTRYYSAWSSHVSGETDPLRPAVPTGLAPDPSATDHEFIGWTWDAVDGASRYEAQVSLTGTFTGNETILITTQTSIRIPVPNPETARFLRVQAVMGSGASATRSGWSEPSTGTTTAPPEPDELGIPANFEISDDGRDSVSLTWGRVTGADHYEVQQRVAGAVSWDPAICDGGDNTVEDNSCEASGLRVGTDYEFRVRAVPASDDDDLTVGDWATAATTGRTPDDAPGGMGDLNVTWESTGNSITWNWAPRTGVGYEWALATGDMDDANPCGGTTFDDLTTAPAGSGNRFSHTISGLSEGDSRGLCVRTDDKDNRATSFAWGVVTPVAATAAQATGVRLNDDMTVASAMTWTDMDLVGGFNWETRLVADPQRGPEFDLTEAAVRTGKDMQAACGAGRSIESGDTDVNYTLDEVAVRSGLTAYTGYALCLRFSNTTGQTAWAVPEAKLFTHPGQPARPTIDSARSTDTSFVWQVATRTANNVPRQTATSPAGRFEVRTIHYDTTFADPDDTTPPIRQLTTATPTAKDCEARTAPTGRGTWATNGTTGAIGTDGAGIVLRAGPFTANVGADANTRGRDQRVFICVRAVDGADRNGPWQISGASIVRGVPGT